MIDSVIWKNKSIRNYLNNFKEEDGSKVIRATLLLGIDYLRREGQVPGNMTAADLEEFTVNILAAGGNFPKTESPQQSKGLTNVAFQTKTISELDQTVPAGVQVAQDEQQEDRQKRSSSVPSKIRGFTLKADTSWRKGDSSQGRDPRKSINETMTWEEQVYPKWWADTKPQIEKVNNHSDELDMKISKKQQEFQKAQVANDQTLARSDNFIQTSPPTKDQFVDTRAEIINQQMSMRPQAELAMQQEIQPEVTYPPRQIDQTKRSEGFQVTFSPATKSRKNPVNHDNTHNERKPKENRSQNEIQPHKVERRSHERFMKSVPSFGNTQARPTTAKAKGNSKLKTLNDRNSAIARQKRDQMMRTRTGNQTMQSIKAESYFPKKLEGVQSVIKNRVKVDKEIGRRRKARNQNMDKDPQIYVASPKNRSQE